MSEHTDLVVADDQPEMGRVARFGQFTLDLRSGELTRSGIRVPLQEQPFQILRMLIAKPGEIVTREELREHLWPTEFVDFERGLNTAVRKLRAALDDSAENPRFVETLARRGYRFIAPVVWPDQEQLVPAPALETGEAPRRSALFRPAMLAIGLLLIVATLLVVWWKFRPEARRSVDSIAVLPFVHDRADTAPLASGMTELLVDAIGRNPSVRVLARSAMFRYERQKVDPVRVGRELGVSGIVTGTVRRNGESYEIRVELVDVRDGKLLWSDRFNASPATLPTVQTAIADELNATLSTRPAGERRTPRMTTNREAYDYYIRGLYAWNRRDITNLRRAIDLFNRSIEADPGFAAPWSGLASTYGVMVGYGWISPAAGAPKVIAAATRALQLDPENAAAHASIAATKFRQEWDWEGAEREFKEAIRLNPDYATAHVWYAEFLRAMGRLPEARAEVAKGYELDPLSPSINASFCWGKFFEGRYEEARDFSRKVAEVDPRFKPTRCLAFSLLMLGEYDALAAELESTGHATDREAAAAVRREGRRGFLRHRIAQCENRPETGEGLAVDLASFYALDGNVDEAFRWLEIGYRNRVSRVTSVPFDPTFAALRGDPRLENLLRRMKYPEEVVVAATRPLPSPPSR